VFLQYNMKDKEQQKPETKKDDEDVRNDNHFDDDTDSTLSNARLIRQIRVGIAKARSEGRLPTDKELGF
jgi:hypothetical protein